MIFTISSSIESLDLAFFAATINRGEISYIF